MFNFLRRILWGCNHTYEPYGRRTSNEWLGHHMYYSESHRCKKCGNIKIFQDLSIYRVHYNLLIKETIMNDLRPHNTDSDDCWCNPTIEDGMVIHNSMDQREKYETGELKLN